MPNNTGTELTTPRPRWIPEQVKHMNTPRLTDDHVGGDLPSQSAHCRLSGCLTNADSSLRCFCLCASLSESLPPRSPTPIVTGHGYKRHFCDWATK
eukprot:7473859-Pyramimonas_sp.AAC.2